MIFPFGESARRSQPPSYGLSHKIFSVTRSRHTLMCLDLVTEKILWDKPYDGGCDRLALSPNGKIIYLPSLEKGHWHVVDAISGEIIKRLETDSGAHNTIFGLDGGHA